MSFSTVGAAEVVARFLNDLTGAMADPRLDEEALCLERRIIEAERPEEFGGCRQGGSPTVSLPTNDCSVVPWMHQSDEQNWLRRPGVRWDADVVQIRQAVRDDIAAVSSMSADPGLNAMTEQAIRDEFESGRMREEWTWLAFDDEGRLIGRALWWGRDDTAPIALDVFDVALVDEVAPIGLSAEVGKSLLLAGHGGLRARGWPMPLPHTVRLPGGWRSDPASVEAVAWRRLVAAEAGLTQVNERLQFEWAAGTELPPNPMKLDFHEGSDAVFQRMFSEAAIGSLDVLTQRTLAVSTPEDLGRDEFDFYCSCPGDREWWRVATDSSGASIGFVVPSATPHSVNVGYLGVLPDHRGFGYVDDLLAYVTTFHQSLGAARITATTDATNVPMTKAFTRHGYRNVEVRLDLEAPPAPANR